MWGDYCVSKLSMNEGLISTIEYYENLGENLSPISYQADRSWMVKQINNGKSFCSIKKNINEMWTTLGLFTYNDERFRWFIVPENSTKRKVFISYYHKDDQLYKEAFKILFGDLITHKSVEDGDIDSQNSDGYIKQLIHKGYLNDTTVLIVLVGPNTKHRKHVDWEISGALDYRVGDKYAGILALKLPTHPDFGTGEHNYARLPNRLSDNLRSNYAIIRDWTTDRIELQKYIELAFSNRDFDDRINNSRIQMQENTN